MAVIMILCHLICGRYLMGDQTETLIPGLKLFLVASFVTEGMAIDSGT